METKEIKLSKLSRKLFEEFAAEAQAWGYQSTEGSGPYVLEAERKYEAARKKLEKRISYLEKKLKSIKNVK